MSAPPSRRHLLQLAGAAAGTLWLPRSAWSQLRAEADPFRLGVASGSPEADSVVLWTRLLLNGTARRPLPEAGAVTVQWEVAHDEAFARPVRRGQAQALPELAHAVHVEVPGLAPDRVYFYRFMSGDAVSPVGRTRTSPAPDPSKMSKATQKGSSDESIELPLSTGMFSALTEYEVFMGGGGSIVTTAPVAVGCRRRTMMMPFW